MKQLENHKKNFQQAMNRKDWPRLMVLYYGLKNEFIIVEPLEKSDQDEKLLFFR